MLVRQYVRDGHTWKITVTREIDAGWLVLEQRDNHIIGERRYQDWHRVERVLRTFEFDPISLEYRAP
jgi:hypothetical protein